MQVEHQTSAIFRRLYVEASECTFCVAMCTIHGMVPGLVGSCCLDEAEH